jgi:hypothetical protein
MNCIMPMVEENIFYKIWLIWSHCLLGLNNISQLVSMKPNLKFWTYLFNVIMLCNMSCFAAKVVA